MRKLLKAKDLKVGMKLASGGEVTFAPYSERMTPAAKIHLYVNHVRKTWSKNTEIAIITED